MDTDPESSRFADLVARFDAMLASPPLGDPDKIRAVLDAMEAEASTDDQVRVLMTKLAQFMRYCERAERELAARRAALTARMRELGVPAEFPPHRVDQFFETLRSEANESLREWPEANLVGVILSSNERVLRRAFAPLLGESDEDGWHVVVIAREAVVTALRAQVPRSLEWLGSDSPAVDRKLPVIMADKGTLSFGSLDL